MVHNQEIRDEKCLGEPKPSMLINEISKLFRDRMRENPRSSDLKTDIGRC